MTQAPSRWINRIVGYGSEAPDQLLANPYNFRIHSQQQQDVLLDVLDEVGIIQAVVVNRVTDHVVDGHLRIMLAIKHQEPLVPVIYVEMDEQTEQKALLTFDAVGAMARTDRKILDDLAALVSTTSMPMQTMIDGLIGPMVVPGDTAAATDDARVCPTCGQKIKQK
jgi:hypothetical protein